ncbi:MAG TPA: ribosome small subunit-dependent GTPase A [Candidatus Avacidaminococcus intestinavium]|uniref:Small ribosomal subunit biogenesis GTPase RsgA n=1 Tax=Candidatus Avacidaminococcus intestinavium TaxID=2840684 RepID=A0A9D1MPI4_9FIRM|nr:ribosome small subunit-dependent GTPase A [Candidatus Avacidaminococcus intestinavium]
MIAKQGRVIKNYMGYYYVDVGNNEIVTCKVKGKMKQNRFSLFTGDFVRLEINGTEGMITEILPRKNFLLRPNVANIDLVVITCAAASPDFSFLLTDKLLALAEFAKIPAVICINKIDLAPKGLIQHCQAIYEEIGYQLLPVSAQTGAGLEELLSVVTGKVTVFAGPSGVGKSSLLNAIDPKITRSVGDVSIKIGRGKHTTRFAHFLPFAEGYIVDTPGFGNVNIDEFKKELLPRCFKEFTKEAPQCRFNGCTHTHEPECAVKEALVHGEIATSRYQSYLTMKLEIETAQERGIKK